MGDPRSYRIAPEERNSHSRRPPPTRLLIPFALVAALTAGCLPGETEPRSFPTAPALPTEVPALVRRATVIPSTTTVHAEPAIPSGDATSTPIPSEIFRVTFVSDRDGNNEIYIMNSDGTGLRRLTDDPAQDLEPAFSWDGARIAFTSDRPQGYEAYGSAEYEIYVMDSDGSHLERLTHNSRSDASPAFSPDGHQIVFTSQRDGAASEIYLMNSDGTGVVRLTNNTWPDIDPAFSPDGRTVVFTTVEAPSDGLWLMDADGSNLSQLTTTTGFDGNASFSPDGRQILFYSDSLDGGGLHVIPVEGGLPRLLTRGPSPSSINPAFSPLGTQILYTTRQDSQEITYLLFVMQADGSSPRPLTDNSANAFMPSAAP